MAEAAFSGTVSEACADNQIAAHPNSGGSLRSAPTTTISTIAVQSGSTRIVIAILQVTRYLRDLLLLLLLLVLCFFVLSLNHSSRSPARHGERSERSECALRESRFPVLLTVRALFFRLVLARRRRVIDRVKRCNRGGSALVAGARFFFIRS